MTLGDIFKQAAIRDLAGNGANGILYSEQYKDGKFHIKLSSRENEEAFVECTLPREGTEDERNYLRTYFLSMVFNSAINGMKRLKQKKKKK